MIREIKFRAWDNEYSKTMFYSNEEHSACSNESGKVLWAIEEDGIHIEVWNYDSWSNPYAEDMHTDRPKQIIMQYTNLKDKNGKEIYEFDLLKSDKTGLIYKVEWDNENAAWHSLCTDQDKNFCLMPDSWSKSEIKGNIYEKMVQENKQ